MKARSSPPATLQQRDQVFFECLGRTIGQWQLIEMQLFRIYARLVRAENTDVASAAFHSVISFATRLDMTEASAKVKLADQPPFPVWRALHKRTVRLSKRRNLLAHFIVVYGVTSGGTPSFDEHGPFLRPSIFDVTRQPATGSARINATRIKTIGDSFERLANDLSEFADSLPAPASSPGKLI